MIRRAAGAIALGLMTALDPGKPRERRAPQGQVIREDADNLAKRIEIHNHLYQMRKGDRYRCMFCCRESLAVRWADAGNVCPLCGSRYNWMMAQDCEE